MKIYLYKYFPKFIFLTIFFALYIILGVDYLKAEDSFFNLDEIKIDSSTKTDDNNSSLPTNPFELVEMIRRSNSMNDATKPSDAVDNALKSFSMMEENKKM